MRHACNVNRMRHGGKVANTVHAASSMERMRHTHTHTYVPWSLSEVTDDLRDLRMLL